MKKYKFQLIRANVQNGADAQLEKIANEHAELGWEFKSTQYFGDILCFLLVFEKATEV